MVRTSNCLTVVVEQLREPFPQVATAGGRRAGHPGLHGPKLWSNNPQERTQHLPQAPRTLPSATAA